MYTSKTYGIYYVQFQDGLFFLVQAENMIGIGFLFLFLVSYLIGCAKKNKERAQMSQKAIGSKYHLSRKEKQTPKHALLVSNSAQAAVPVTESKIVEKSAVDSCAALSDDEANTALEISDVKYSPRLVSDMQMVPGVFSVVEVNPANVNKYKESTIVPIVNEKVVGELVNPKKSKYSFPDNLSLIGITNSKIEQSTIKVTSPNQKIYRASSPPFGLSPINSETKSACSSPGQAKASAATPNRAEILKNGIPEPLVIYDGLK